MARRLRGRCSGIALAALALALLAGCGGSQDETVLEVARGFHDALADRDGAAACAVLTPATRSELEQSSGATCATALLEERIPEVAGDGDVAVFGTMAQVEYADDTVFLARLPEGWRVLAAGCVPRRAGLHDCLVKGA